ncbi:MAG: hypothetical protein M3463_12250, partial [Verrucomicrobiota bacterium]|nr:hypothetical protein [Verrucomicrobiota bacterium]
MEPASFFSCYYEALRGQPPMKWMERLFANICQGAYPRLVDLPTGAGKTELVVIWLCALAWYEANGLKGKPIPRRLVWVVNRRVLVQQVHTLATELLRKLTGTTSPKLEPLRAGMRALSGDADSFFDVVQLRGQIVPDREWAVRPAVPQLIIGTVDQIGSRLLFQGYGLGKWNRPQQAGLLGVDAWIAVDEAHLVPAFVLTLRQLHQRCAGPIDSLAPSLRDVFSGLPFWLTELSATPGLPEPEERAPGTRQRLAALNESAKERGLTPDEDSEREKLEGNVFSLRGEEEQGAAIAPRVFAAKTRRVEITLLQEPKGKNRRELLVSAIIETAMTHRSTADPARVAIFVGEVKAADAVANALKKKGTPESHICKITGRLRGYERDRLIKTNNAVKRFLPQREGEPPNPLAGTVF